MISAQERTDALLIGLAGATVGVAR